MRQIRRMGWEHNMFANFRKEGNTDPSFITDKFFGVYDTKMLIKMEDAVAGGWYDNNWDIVCVWGLNLNKRKLLYIIDHEYMHRILRMFIGLRTSLAMDNLWFTEYFGIDHKGNPLRGRKEYL